MAQEEKKAGERKMHSNMKGKEEKKVVVNIGNYPDFCRQWIVTVLLLNKSKKNPNWKFAKEMGKWEQ